MNRHLHPSPLLIVTAAALLIAFAATAIAGPDALRKAVTKSQVKKIATKEADKRVKALAPSLTVARSGTAGAADSATDAANLGGKPASAYATSAGEPFHEVGAAGQPAFENNWDNFDPNSSTTAAFYKDPLGVVHLKGTIATNAAGNSAPAFTLPAGYRPGATSYMPISPLSVGTTGRLTINSTGQILPWCMESVSCQVSIDGAAFRAGA